MGRWSFGLVGDDSKAIAREPRRGADTMSMVGKTYAVNASARPGSRPGRDGEYADPIDAIPKYGASTVHLPTRLNSQLALTGSRTRESGAVALTPRDP